MQLGVTTIAAAFCIPNPTLLLVSCFASILLIIPLMIYRKQEPLNRILLAAFTFVEAYIVGVVCASKESETLSFEGMQPFLYISLSVLVEVLFLQFFFPYSQVLDLIFTLFGAVLFCAYIVYDTFMMFEKYTVDEYIRAAVELYLDILNLFLRILQLLSNRK
ncbi:inhibitor of apoptosis-promoting Bax1-domain-containing protein [Obelidium mucronatum]|nr:inhibitor of apoptosis-promoting Bax1-domain-containing protein [Obelidium mucronatum]